MKNQNICLSNSKTKHFNFSSGNFGKGKQWKWIDILKIKQTNKKTQIDATLLSGSTGYGINGEWKDWTLEVKMREESQRSGSPAVKYFSRTEEWDMIPEQIHTSS